MFRFFGGNEGLNIVTSSKCVILECFQYRDGWSSRSFYLFSSVWYFYLEMVTRWQLKCVAGMYGRIVRC